MDYNSKCNTKEELAVLELIREDQYITSTEISLHTRLGTQQIREQINHMRSNGIPIVACNKGYRLTNSAQDVSNQIESLLGRINSIYNAIDGLEKAKIILKENNTNG